MNISEAIAATKAARESHPVEVVDLDTHQDASPAAGSHVAAPPKPRPLDGVTTADEFLDSLEGLGLAQRIALNREHDPLCNQDSHVFERGVSLKLGRVTRAEIVDHNTAGDPP